MNRTPSQSLLRFFKYDHLPEPLKSTSERCYQLAWAMENMVPDGPEKTTGLRKLLEAKDCFVRSLLPVEGQAYIGTPVNAETHRDTLADPRKEF